MNRLLPLFAAAFISGCNPANSHYNEDRTPKMDKPLPKIERLFAKTRPICFGRFIIDIPATAEVAWGPTNVDDRIESYPNQGHLVPAQIRDKVKELEEIRHLKEPSTLIGTFDGPNPDSKIVVGYESFETSGLVQLHSYIRLGKHAFVQSAAGAALGRDASGVVNKNRYHQYVSEMQAIARRLRIREETEIPSEQGICIEAGFVAGSGMWTAEMTSIGFRFPEYPDVTFSIRTIKTDRPDETNSLEWSLRKGKEFAGVAGIGDLYARIKTLREGKRRIGDWEGAEKLARKPPVKENPSVHEFMFKSIGVANDPLRPMIDIDLHTGVEENIQGVNEPSLKDDEAVALWDKLTRSIRNRPTGQGETSAPPPLRPQPERS